MNEVKLMTVRCPHCHTEKRLKFITVENHITRFTELRLYESIDNLTCKMCSHEYTIGDTNTNATIKDDPSFRVKTNKK
jgi:rubredoxin